MDIASARHLGPGSIRVVLQDGTALNVPDDPSNRHRRRLAEWEAAGNVIDPFVPPPPPTDDERIDGAFPRSDVARVIFEAFFEIANRVIALEGGAAISRAQLRNWLKAKLP